jgi:DNA-directed RNA polymerase specialized sigma24 family protein
VEHESPFGGALVAPSEEAIHYARRLLIQRQKFNPSDADDIVSEALLDYLKAVKRFGPAEGLFVTIVRRRAADFHRQKARQSNLAEIAIPAAVSPDVRRLETDALVRSTLRFFRRRPHANLFRLAGVVRRIADGESFPEACRSEAIPRGSRGRCLRALRECFAWLETRPSNLDH